MSKPILDLKIVFAVSCFLLLIFIGCSNVSEKSIGDKSPEEILKSFVEDFRRDPSADDPVTFGVRIRCEGGGDWHIVVGEKDQGKEETEVTLKEGFPAEGVGYFDMELSTLRKIDNSEMSILTAMGKARSSDTAPVEFEVTEGFDPGDQFWSRLTPLIFHFWNRGLPEVVRFNKESSRVVHGANTTLFYYERVLRTAWYQIEKGQHINEDPKDQVNDFPSMFIFTRGKAKAQIGGAERDVHAGEMIFVPEGMTHEFWNENKKPCEFVLIMFGENA